MKRITMQMGLVTLLTTTALIGCSDNDNDTMTPVTPPPPPPATMKRFDIEVVNLTAAQPLSPIAVVAHEQNTLFAVGQPASEALEIMAEGGDNSEIVSADFIDAYVSGSAPLPPGESQTLNLAFSASLSAKISIVSMLVNTNDGFSGLNGVDVSTLDVGDNMTLRTVTYDAGTEKNTEAAGTIPGPADNGEGFNAARDDVNFVAMHPGVVSQDDGLRSSVLTQTHRFDNPTMAITITRTE
ncbi:spondin domain-containing protein [Aestuariibacter sp. AA17]|uniref:Spondin domain-containing protein n=1 Tax=Fluctibacter corallii TaxID=2984329 RepID=A0ABT3A3W5_9ALTE|nr:spondin domain-containing protein [Aestuariibacter sp. AA17]MCV2883380.1 spondin domain-containing protein [Aestuariibacter sp. AA17]